MEAVFLKLVNMSVTAGWLVLAVLVLRLLLRNAPKSIRCVLWGLVGLRLVLPVSVESVFSLIPSAEPVSDPIQVIQRNWNAETVTTPIIPDAAGSAAAPAAPGVSMIETSITGTASAAPVQAPSLTSIFAAVWLVGMAVLLAYSIVSYLRLRRRVATAVRLRDNLYQSEAVDSPFILGLLRPRIYLPFRMDEGSMAPVIAHEQAHIRRRDHWWKPLGFLLLAVYWFNPLIWVAYILLCRDIELACDERVIRDMSAEEKKAYSSALLQCSVSRRSIAACPLAFGEVGVKARIKNVLSYKKPAFWVILVAVIACIIAAVCFLTNPPKPESLRWAQDLRESDLILLEVSHIPDSDSEGPQAISQEAWPQVLALLNGSNGSAVKDPEEVSGTATVLYVTTGDGVCHEVKNIGNVYLVIDGDYYEASYDWLDSWAGLLNGIPTTDIAVPLFWAQHLTADQVTSIEWTSDTSPDLTACSEADYETFISLLNRVEGSAPDDSDFPSSFVTDPAPGWPTLYITTDDQTVHTVTIITNSILRIDGVRFDVGTEWMDEWYDTVERILPFALYGDSPMTWIQNLTADSVSGIACGPTKYLAENEEDAEAINAIVKRLNACQGELLTTDLPEPADTGWTLSITTTNDIEHTLSICGDQTLCIDGFYFSADPSWLKAWWEELLDYASGGIYSGRSPALTTIAQADLDHDGQDEQIQVEEVAAGLLYSLLVRRADGTLLYSNSAAFSHNGWNSLFLCEIDGQDYLLQYYPEMYQGYAQYSYAVFSLTDEAANRAVSSFDTGFVEFDIIGHYPLPVEEMVTFAEQVNGYLSRSTLLLSTLDSEVDIGPASAAPYLEDYDGWLYRDSPVDQSIYEDGDSLAEKLEKYSSYAYVSYHMDELHGSNFDLIAQFGNDCIVLRYNFTDAKRLTIPIQYSAGALYFSMADEDNGAILYCGSGADGRMHTLLYSTADGWASYETAELSDQLDGSPNSLTMQTAEKGYLGVYRSGTSYLYETADGGKTWQAAARNGLPSPCTGYAPLFPDNQTTGYLLLDETAAGSGYCYTLYQTEDGGASWHEIYQFSTAAPVKYYFIIDDDYFSIDPVFSVVDDQYGMYQYFLT